MRRAAPSLQRRLAWLLFGIVAALVLLAGLSLRLALGHVVDAFVVTRLAHDRDTLISALRADGPRPGTLPLVYRRTYSGHYYQIASPGGELRSRSLWDGRLELPALAPGDRWQGERVGPQGRPLLVLAIGVRLQDGDYVVAVAEDLSALKETANRIGLVLIAGGLVLLAVFGLVQRKVLRALLGSLERLRYDTARVEHGEARELPRADTPIEVLPLVDAFNRALSALSTRLSRSRRAVGDLAHALKTPLTALAQLGREEPIRGSEAGERLQRHVEHIRRIMDSQLRRARLAGGGAPGVSVAVAEHVHELVDTLKRIFGDKDVTFDVRVAEQIRFPGDREDLLELLGVLLDNACRWAAGRVAVTVESNGAFVLTVEDDGPGVEPKALSEISRRGGRLDESAPGAGLGLSVARTIVEEYGGHLRFEPHGRLGGLTVRVELPSSPGQSSSFPAIR